MLRRIVTRILGIIMILLMMIKLILEKADEAKVDEANADLLLLLHLLPEALLVGERVWQGVAVTHLAQPEISDERFRCGNRRHGN